MRRVAGAVQRVPESSGEGPRAPYDGLMVMRGEFAGGLSRRARELAGDGWTTHRVGAQAGVVGDRGMSGAPATGPYSPAVFDSSVPAFCAPEMVAWGKCPSPGGGEGHWCVCLSRGPSATSRAASTESSQLGMLPPLGLVRTSGQPQAADRTRHDRASALARAEGAPVATNLLGGWRGPGPRLACSHDPGRGRRTSQGTRRWRRR